MPFTPFTKAAPMMPAADSEPAEAAAGVVDNEATEPPPDPQAMADMHTLVAAQKIRAHPTRHAAARAMAKKHLAAFTKVASGRSKK